MVSDLKKLNVQTRPAFVRDAVEVTPVTNFIIDQIMPYFPMSSKVIGGYVDASKQFWKSNFHWEYLIRHLDKALKMTMADNHILCVKAIKAVLEKNPPNPPKGYIASRKMGTPQDSSSQPLAYKRWKSMRQCKKDFKRVLQASKLLGGMSKKKKKQWLLAVAPVARPGRSKHSTGYAIDLYGTNTEIIRITKALNASLVFPEGSHVHVEFKNGVAGHKYTEPMKNVIRGNVLVFGPEWEQDMCLMSPSQLAELKNDTRQAAATGIFGEEIAFLDVIKDILDDALGEDWW